MQFEQKRGHVASGIECYMKQYGVSEEQVYSEFYKQVENAWLDINKKLRKTSILYSHSKDKNFDPKLLLLDDGPVMHIKVIGLKFTKLTCQAHNLIQKPYSLNFLSLEATHVHSPYLMCCDVIHES